MADLLADIARFRPPGRILGRVGGGVRFELAAEGDAAEVIALQERHFPAWKAFYEHQLMVPGTVLVARAGGRVYRPVVPGQRVAVLQAVRRYLASHGVPRAGPIPAPGGRGWESFYGRAVEVEPFAAAPAAMRTLARVRTGVAVPGRIHALLPAFPGRPGRRGTPLRQPCRRCRSCAGCRRRNPADPRLAAGSC